jgi:cobalt-zinc-cadmium efflux system protein
MSEHNHHHHPHARPGSAAALYGALALTLCFAAVEAVGGWWAGSLALLGDAGHMFSDAVALGLAALAVWFSRQPPSARHTYGLVRAEVVAALFNGLLMLAVVVGIVVEAIERLRAPESVPVAGGVVTVVALIGLAINVAVAFMLSRGDGGLNTRGALLHVMGDLMGSVAALIAGAVIYFTGWTPIDPILSMAICALILFSTVKLLREALHVLMEGVPPNINLEAVGFDMARVPGVASVHELHIWALSSGVPSLSAHVVLRERASWGRVLAEMQTLLRERYDIEHVTLQPEITLAAPTGRKSVIAIQPKAAKHVHKTRE